MHTAILQGFNYLFPVLLLPILIRAIGPGRYAEMIYFQGIASLMIVLTDFGFNTTAVRDISLAKLADRNQMRDIFLRTQYVKMLLLGFSLLLALAYCFVFHIGLYRTLLLLSSSLIVIGQIAIPTYFFLAIEKMVYITYSLIVARGLYILLLILLVRKPEDFVLVNPLMGLCYLAAGAYLHYVLFSRYMSLKGVAFRPGQLFRILRQDFPIFISSLSSNILINYNAIFLGTFPQASQHIVGNFIVVEKIISSIRGVATAYMQVIFPRACVIKQNRQPLRRFYQGHLALLGGLLLFGLLVLINQYEFIFNFLTGKKHTPTLVQYYFILWLLVPLLATGNMLLIQALTLENLTAWVGRISFAVSVVFIAAGYFWFQVFAYNGLIFNVYQYEITLMIALFTALVLRRASRRGPLPLSVKA